MTETDLHRMGVLARRIATQEDTLTAQLAGMINEIERLRMGPDESMRTLLYLAMAGALSHNPTLSPEEFWTRIVHNFQVTAQWMANDLAQPPTPAQIH